MRMTIAKMTFLQKLIHDRISRIAGASVICLVVVTTGCSTTHFPVADGQAGGRVILLPGIQSQAWYLKSTVEGLQSAGLRWDIEIIEWGSYFPGAFDNLMNLARNEKRAAGIARKIASYRADRPDEPVTLIGYSGGGGLAVLIAEALPDDVRLDRMILIAAAISPRHDLSKSLSHTERGIVNFYSERDVFILGAGTWLFGTIDRVHTKSAGLVGFRDASDQLIEHDDIRQIGWRRDWQDYGHYGGHTSWLSGRWSQQVLAPLIGRVARGVYRKGVESLSVSGSGFSCSSGVAGTRNDVRLQSRRPRGATLQSGHPRNITIVPADSVTRPGRRGCLRVG